MLFFVLLVFGSCSVFSEKTFIYFVCVCVCMKKRCYQCKKQINLKKEKYVLLGTYDSENDFVHESYYHFSCWLEYFGKFKNQAQKLNEATSQGFSKVIGGLLGRADKITKKMMNDLDIPEEDIVVTVDPLDEFFVDNHKKKKKGKTRNARK